MSRGYRDEDKWRKADDDVVRFSNCFCIAASDDAILVRMGKGKEIWFPQSQVHDDSEVYRKGDEGMLVVSEWIAKKKGLI